MKIIKSENYVLIKKSGSYKQTFDAAMRQSNGNKEWAAKIVLDEMAGEGNWKDWNQKNLERMKKNIINRFSGIKMKIIKTKNYKKIVVRSFSEDAEREEIILYNIFRRVLTDLDQDKNPMAAIEGFKDRVDHLQYTELMFDEDKYRELMDQFNSFSKDVPGLMNFLKQNLLPGKIRNWLDKRNLKNTIMENMPLKEKLEDERKDNPYILDFSPGFRTEPKLGPTPRLGPGTGKREGPGPMPGSPRLRPGSPRLRPGQNLNE